MYVRGVEEPAIIVVVAFAHGDLVQLLAGMVQYTL
jgi:succinate-acetate transporter protein